MILIPILAEQADKAMKPNACKEHGETDSVCSPQSITPDQNASRIKISWNSRNQHDLVGIKFIWQLNPLI